MRDFFEAESVAVIGVSASPTNLGRAIVHNLTEFRFPGVVYPVGPKGGAFMGHKIYRSVLEIPDPVDLAVILIPAPTIPEVLKECGEKGIKRVVIESSGFSEFSEDRKNLEKEIAAQKEKADKQDAMIAPKQDFNGPLASIVIPLYNQLEYTRKCLLAVLKNTLYAPYEIIFVNDASQDGTYEYLEELKQKNSAIKVIHNEQNLGFAASCNRGAKAAKGDYIVFLNNDTEAQKEWLVNLVASAHNDALVGAVGSKLLYPDGTIQHAGVLVTRDEKAGNLLAPWHLHNGKPADFEAANQPFLFQAVTAACMLVSKEAFEQAAGFDEEFRNGYEDVDLCFTMGQQGKRILYQPESVVIHYESKSGAQRFAFMNDNTKRLHEKWLDKILPDTVLKKDGTAHIVKDAKAGPYLHWQSRFVPETDKQGMLRQVTPEGGFAFRRTQHDKTEQPVMLRQAQHDNSENVTLSLSKGGLSKGASTGSGFDPSGRRTGKLSMTKERHPEPVEGWLVEGQPVEGADAGVKLRIGYLSLGPDNLACPQLRLKSPLTELEKQGQIEIVPFNLQNSKEVSLNLNDLRSLDILIVQRHFTAAFSYQQLAEALGERRPKIIFEFDDALDRLPQSNPGYAYHKQLKPRFEEYIRNADLVTVSTEQLKEYYSDWNENIIVLPNLLDGQIWQESFKKTKKQAGKIRMLFAGTNTHAADFAMIAPAVQKILAEYKDKVELLLWGEEALELKGHPNVKVIKDFEFTYANYAKALQELSVDFALVPLADDDFNKAKSNIKWLEYSASKIPGIYSDIRPYSEFIKHNKTGILIKNDIDSWYKAIKNLAGNAKKRKTIGRAAHRQVWKNFVLKDNINRWIDAYNSIVSEKKFSSLEGLGLSGVRLSGYARQTGSRTGVASASHESNKKSVSIIIPVFNKLDFTKGCIEAIYENTHVADFEIIVVDNASTDGSAEYLAELRHKKDNVIVVSNKENAGFAGANNQAAKIANSKYLVFLNNDTEVQPDWLKAMLNIVENDNEVGIVGSKLLYPDNTIQHAGVWILDHRPSGDPLLAMNAYVNQAQDFAPANQSMTYQAVTAACMLVSKDRFLQLGGFDEGFWNGYEDVDLCFRFAEQGLKIVYQPQSVVIHHESKSGQERFSKVKENIERLHHKWLGKVEADYVVDGENNVHSAGSAKIGPYLQPQQESGQKALVSIIMLTYNALEYTKMTFESIKANTQYPWEIIFVDNASTDGTKKYLRELQKAHGNVHVVFNKENKGFSAGNNQGVKKANGEYVLFLNNDVLVAKGWLQNLVEALQKDDGIGMLGPITNYISGLQMVEDVPYKDVSGFPQYAAQVAQLNKDKITPRRRIAGFAVLMDKEVFSQLGGFDESFGSGNFEDDDLCLRVRQEGFAIMVHEGVYIHHFGSQTFKANKIDYSASLQERGARFREKWPQVDYEELLEQKNPLSRVLEDNLQQAQKIWQQGEGEKALEVYLDVFRNEELEEFKCFFRSLQIFLN